MQWSDDTTLPSRGLGLRPIGKSKLAAFDAAGDISSTPIIEPAGITPPPRHRAASERAASRHGSARLIAKCKRRHSRTYSKMLMALAAGPPTIIQDRANVAAFPRNVERDLVADENRRDLGLPGVRMSPEWRRGPYHSSGVSAKRRDGLLPTGSRSQR